MDEYIKRKDAVDWFMSFIHLGEDNLPVETVVSDLKYAIPATDTDVEPVRHSEWVAQCLLPGDGWVFEDMPYNPHQHSNPICKRCRKGALLDGGEEYVTSPYCPNCGAKMDGGKKNAGD